MLDRARHVLPLMCSPLWMNHFCLPLPLLLLLLFMPLLLFGVVVVVVVKIRLGVSPVILVGVKEDKWLAMTRGISEDAIDKFWVDKLEIDKFGADNKIGVCCCWWWCRQSMLVVVGITIVCWMLLLLLLSLLLLLLLFGNCCWCLDDILADLIVHWKKNKKCHFWAVS